MAAPILADMAREFAGRCVVLKVNTDELPALGARYSVRGIPHFAVLRAGAVAAQQSGVLQPAAMRQWLARALG
jgi:thioredoxin-like negative regulator of GroEL